MGSIVSSTLLFAAKKSPSISLNLHYDRIYLLHPFIKCRCLHSKFCCIRVVNPSSHISNSSSPVYLLPRMPAEVARNRHKESGKHLNKWDILSTEPRFKAMSVQHSREHNCVTAAFYVRCNSVDDSPYISGYFELHLNTWCKVTRCPTFLIKHTHSEGQKAADHLNWNSIWMKSMSVFKSPALPWLWAMSTLYLKVKMFCKGYTCASSTTAPLLCPLNALKDLRWPSLWCTKMNFWVSG